MYDLVGNLRRTYYDGGVTDYVYDALNRLDVLTHYGPDYYGPGYLDPDDFSDNPLLSRFDYTVRADGKRTNVVETLPHDSDGNGSTDTTVTNQVDWIYDRLGRLIQEDFDWDTTPGEDSLDFTADYIFDLVGNRKEKHVDNGRDAVVDEIFTYEYDLNDRLLTELKDVDGWADDRLTVYGYDGTQQTSKSVHATETDDGLTTSDPVIEQTDTTYNLQGRMDSAEVSQYDSTGTTLQSHKRSTYEYDDSGIRVAKTDLNDVNNDGDFDDVGTDTSERTDYHVDHRNPTGYAQVLEEMHGDTVVKSYTIGHDVFLEAVAANQTRRLLKDGHGSTRMLVDALGNVIANGTTPQVFAYDAYGLPVGFDLNLALTTHLYSGEQTDQLTGLQYLRARYYNPATGTFNRLDPFAGNFSDPQSLHKYLYTAGDPVNGIDPSGLAMPEWLEGLGVMGTRVHMYLAEKFKNAITFGLSRWAGQTVRTIALDILTEGSTVPVNAATWQYPDLAERNRSSGDIYEIKRGSIEAMADATAFKARVTASGARPQLERYKKALNEYTPVTWNNGTTFNQVMRTWPDFPYAEKDEVLVTFTRYDVEPGVILYTFIPKKEEDHIYDYIPNAVALALMYQHMNVYNLTFQAKFMANATREFQKSRLKSHTATFSTVASVGVAVGIGSFAF